MNLYFVRSAVVFALLLGTAAHAAPPAAGPAFTEPKTFGQLHQIMMMGKSDPNVKLSELPRSNVYAVGALSGMRGEVTILDGTVWLSYGSNDGTIKTQSSRAREETATLLVYSQVSQWQKVQLPKPVPFAELDTAIERIAKEQGIDTSKPFPLRVEGQLSELRWHSLKGQTPKPGGHSHADHDQLVVSKTAPKVKGQLVGFFSTSHHGVFTHMGQNTHLHVVLPVEKQMGHVDSVSIVAGATLYLPR